MECSSTAGEHQHHHPRPCVPLPTCPSLLPLLPPNRYESRGWCNFERAEGQLIKPDGFCIDIGLFTVDLACEEYSSYGRSFTPLRIGTAPFAQRSVGELGKQGSYIHSGIRGALGKLVGRGRRAPFSPDAFAEVLRTSCTFTNGADSSVVVELYCSTATALLGSTTELRYEQLEWAAADYQRLGEALPYCGALESLVLMCMNPDAAGSAAVQAWVLPPSLKTLFLYSCASLTSLPSLSALTSLQTLDLTHCRSLTSLPDASALTPLEAVFLDPRLEPWRAGGFKAWDLPA